MELPSNLQFFAGGRSSIQAITDVINSAERELVVDVFVARESDVTTGIQEATRRGVHVTTLVDPEKMSGTLGPGDVTNSVLYGEMPLKNHAKSAVADLERGAITTAAYLPASLGRGEMTATFDGPAAAALGELTHATAANDTPRVQAAAARAREFGIVVNDHRAGVDHLTQSVRELITGAKQDLLIVTKRMQSDTYKQLLEDARARGVNVQVLMPSNMHATAIIQDGTAAYMGSAHLSGRSLNIGRTTGRQSRELGLHVTDSEAVAQVRRAMVTLGALSRADPGVGPFQAASGVERLCTRAKVVLGSGTGKAAIAVAAATIAAVAYGKLRRSPDED